MEDHGDVPDSAFLGNFDELLTEQVRTHPGIYNTHDEFFKSPTRKEDMWRQIADTLDVSVDICCSRWRTLRERYVKKKKTISEYPETAERIIGHWPLFSEIEDFLSPFISHRRKSGLNKLSEVDLKQEGSGSEDYPSASSTPASVNPKCNNDNVVIQKRRPLPSAVQRRRLLKRHQGVLNSGNNSHTAHVAALRAIAEMQQPAEEDEESHFGHIVAATLRRLPPRQRAQTKLVIYQVLVDSEFPPAVQGEQSGAGVNTSGGGFLSISEHSDSPYIQVPKLETE